MLTIDEQIANLSKSDRRLYNQLDNLFTRHEKVPESGCWLWVGAVTASGHGQISYNGKYQMVHRLMYALFHPPETWKGHIIRHKCDVPCCINPDHLECGTQGDNMRDMRERGRASWQRAK